MAYTTTIGLEVHAELKTATKMFCRCKNDPDENKPNHNICPVCTVEAHEFSAITKEFGKSGTLVFGLSPDDIASHHKFIKKDGITYPLLADTEHKVAEKYGIWVEKSMYGKRYMGIERSTFVVGKDGKLEQVYRKVAPEGHAVCVLTDIAKSK